MFIQINYEKPKESQVQLSMTIEEQKELREQLEIALYRVNPADVPKVDALLAILINPSAIG